MYNTLYNICMQSRYYLWFACRHIRKQK